MPLVIASRIETFPSLPSTQIEARSRLERGEDVAGLVVRAARQTQGRGRRDRRWESAPGGSYQTLVVRDPAPPSLGRGAVAVAVAVGLAETLGRYGAKTAIKWPNDLLYLGRKLGGVLTEYSHAHLLVGVGLNVANAPPGGAAALRGWDLEGVHGAVLEGVQRGLDAWLADESVLPERFTHHDALLGRTVSVESGEAVVTGEALGIDAHGCLLLATAEGPVRVCSGSVRGISAPPDH